MKLLLIIGACLIVALSLAARFRARSKNRQADQYNPEAKRLLERQAESGDIEAQLELGRKYSLGEYGSVDNATASKWERKAIEQQFETGQTVDGVALFTMGVRYFTGDGLPHNEVVASVLLTLAMHALKDEDLYEDAAELQGKVQQRLTDCQLNQGQQLMRQMDKENSIFSPIDDYLAWLAQAEQADQAPRSP